MINVIANLIETLSMYAAGMVSIVFGYEPEIPDELKYQYIGLPYYCSPIYI